MNNKKILITGGAGFIGSNLALALQEKYPNNKYYIVDNFSSGNADNLVGFRGEIIHANIAEINFNKYFDKLDIIFHQAAITNTTVFDEKKMMFNNVDGFKNVLNFALKCEAKLIYASSAAIYGRSIPPMIVGKNEVPANMYGVSKLEADKIARENFNNLPIIGLRYFNVYGPGEKYKGKMANVIWQFYLQMKDGKKPIVFGNGEQKRDQVYVRDVVNANILAIDCQKSGIFNIGSGRATSFNEIIKNLNEVLGADFEPEYIDNPYKHYQEYTEADLTETKKILGYFPEYDIKKGVKDYFKK